MNTSTENFEKQIASAILAAQKRGAQWNRPKRDITKLDTEHVRYEDWADEIDSAAQSARDNDCTEGEIVEQFIEVSGHFGGITIQFTEEDLKLPISQLEIDDRDWRQFDSAKEIAYALIKEADEALGFLQDRAVEQNGGEPFGVDECNLNRVGRCADALRDLRSDPEAFENGGAFLVQFCKHDSGQADVVLLDESVCRERAKDWADSNDPRNGE